MIRTCKSSNNLLGQILHHHGRGHGAANAVVEAEETAGDEHEGFDPKEGSNAH